jgi:hypothetical protein
MNEHKISAFHLLQLDRNYKIKLFFSTVLTDDMVS